MVIAITIFSSFVERPAERKRSDRPSKGCTSRTLYSELSIWMDFNAGSLLRLKKVDSVGLPEGGGRSEHLHKRESRII